MLIFDRKGKIVPLDRTCPVYHVATRACKYSFDSLRHSKSKPYVKFNQHYITILSLLTS